MGRTVCLLLPEAFNTDGVLLLVWSDPVFPTFLFPGQAVYFLCVLCVISSRSFQGREGVRTILGSSIRPLCVLSYLPHPLPPVEQGWALM